MVVRVMPTNKLTASLNLFNRLHNHTRWIVGLISSCGIVHQTHTKHQILTLSDVIVVIINFGRGSPSKGVRNEIPDAVEVRSSVYLKDVRLAVFGELVEYNRCVRIPRDGQENKNVLNYMLTR